NINGNYSMKNIHAQLIPMSPTSCSSLLSQTSINIISSLECSFHAKYILTIADFCFWYDVRSTLLDIIDRVVTMNEVQHYIVEKNHLKIVKFCLPQLNTKYRKIKRSKNSIATQTLFDHEQRRNAKIQTNTLTLFSIQKQNLSSSKLFLN
ncbi:unnamed protein product, partial [Rotaria sp. Silwood1]